MDEYTGNDTSMMITTKSVLNVYLVRRLFITMASRFEKVDDEYIEELKAKGENENTNNSTEW